ncbi:MAG: rhodanese-like domain-containing protein [Firmicutes bacterium]|nr:rhodanese-like domain-containing protein [Bacillota bacterium]
MRDTKDRTFGRRAGRLASSALRQGAFGVCLIVAFSLLCGCDRKEEAAEEERPEAGFMQISQEEAKSMMEKDDGHVIVDVRRKDEYIEGHIPGAICIPNESITDEMPEKLPDLGQTILIYCRSGRRSKEAAAKLAAIGYTDIYEFGGIIDWDGEIEAGI